MKLVKRDEKGTEIKDQLIGTIEKLSVSGYDLHAVVKIENTEEKVWLESPIDGIPEGSEIATGSVIVVNGIYIGKAVLEHACLGKFEGRMFLGEQIYEKERYNLENKTHEEQCLNCRSMFDASGSNTICQECIDEYKSNTHDDNTWSSERLYEMAKRCEKL